MSGLQLLFTLEPSPPEAATMKPTAFRPPYLSKKLRVWSIHYSQSSPSRLVKSDSTLHRSRGIRSQLKIYIYIYILYYISYIYILYHLYIYIIYIYILYHLSYIYISYIYIYYIISIYIYIIYLYIYIYIYIIFFPQKIDQLFEVPLRQQAQESLPLGSFAASAAISACGHATQCLRSQQMG